MRGNLNSKGTLISNAFQKGMKPFGKAVTDILEQANEYENEMQQAKAKAKEEEITK